MIISKKNDKKNDKKNLNHSISKSMIGNQENDFKIEFMNSVFKKMVGIPAEIQIENDKNTEII